MSGLSGSLLVLTLRFLYFFSPGDRFSGVVYVPYRSPFCSGRGGAGSRLRLRPPSRPAPSPQTVTAPSARGRHDTRRRRGFHYHGALMTDDAQMGVSSQSRPGWVFSSLLALSAGCASQSPCSGLPAPAPTAFLQSHPDSASGTTPTWCLSKGTETDGQL